MPRSRSPDSQRRSDSSSRQLPGSAEPISESDYFLKSAEFRVWLKEEKHKYFDELSGEKARRYFHKFVKEWNRGKLDTSLYAGVDPSKQSATSQTAYKWAFASKRTKADNDALQAARTEVGAATYGVDNGPPPTTSGGDGSVKRIQGPTLPPQADRILAREDAEERAAAEREYQRKRDKAETRERIEDMVGPREVGRERMLEKKRDRREGDRAFREKGDEGLDIDEKTLMGGGDSFKAQVARRDAARARFEKKREEKMSTTRERAAEMREKDKATMDMFMQMAKQKYG
ncbi:hypothetical protein F5888DRAFT_1603097 [Russula emetica]|nr:hypothetical protein F5888DRAFT_1603097 [Russula emetica]